MNEASESVGNLAAVGPELGDGRASKGILRVEHCVHNLRQDRNRTAASGGVERRAQRRAGLIAGDTGDEDEEETGEGDETAPSEHPTSERPWADDDRRHIRLENA